MTGAEIIKLTREGVLYDNAHPFLWSENLLNIYLNEAEREAARRASLLVDKTTVNDNNSLPLTKLNLVPGQSEYVVSPKILRLKRAVPSWDSVSFRITTEGFLDEKYPFWRDDTGDPCFIFEDKGVVTVTPTPIENEIKAISGATRVGQVVTVNLVDHGYFDGRTIQHADFDAAEYNVSAVITKIDANNYSYVVSGSPVTPATGDMTATEVDTIQFEVVRLPLNDMNVVIKEVAGIARVGQVATATLVGHGYETGDTPTQNGAIQAEYNITGTVTKIDDDNYSYVVNGAPDTPATGTLTTAISGEPEIPEEHHFALSDWIVNLALRNHDKDAENLAKAREHDNQFTQKFGVPISARTEAKRRRSPRNASMTPKEFGFP
ncbi:MAG: hypothetical protein KAR06_02410 [Deltaproteobacteria bacterium]|nr:hypothetical protein [Deltaproteobacteria bacterium]